MIEAGPSPYSSSVARSDFLKVLVFSGLVGLVLVISIYSLYLGISALALLLAGLALGINLRLAVLALIFLIPFDPQIGLPGKTFLYFDLFFAALLWPFAWFVQSGRLRANRSSLWLGPYVFFAIVTTIWRAEAPYWFWGSSVRWGIALVLAAVVSSAVNGERAILALGLSLIPVCLYGIYQLLIQDVGRVFTLLNPHFPDYEWQGRANSLFANWNPYGGFCGVVAVMLLALALRTENRVGRILYMTLSGLGVLGLLSSGSRGGLLATGAALLLLLVLSKSNWSVRYILSIALLFGILTVVTMSLLPLQRIETLDDYTVQGRLTLYGTALLLFLQHPVIGVGLTNFGQLLPRVIVWNYENVAAHNTYLQVLAENGVVGFLLFFVPLFGLMYKNLRAARESTIALASALGLSVVMVHGLTDYLLSDPQYMLMFAVVLGLASKCVASSSPVLDGRG